jgi:hypothetical protein
MRVLGGITLCLVAAGAHAQATRTWVSGVGDDVNPCSRTAPCASFAGAIVKTAAGGEISVLDPGDFGPVIVTKSITIDGGGGLPTGIGGQPLGDAITIDIPALQPTGARVNLRNLSLNGFGGVGANGIRVKSSVDLSIDHLFVGGYAQNCVLIESGATGARVDIAHSMLYGCQTGVANQAAATVNLSEETVVWQNTVVGASVNDTQGLLYRFNASVRGNAVNIDEARYISGASASLSGGAIGCALASQQFAPPSSLGGGALPGGATPVGAGFRFTTTDCGAGASVSISVTYSQALPQGTVLYKFGPASAGAASTWFVLPATFSADRKTVTYSVTDNGVGDTNLTDGFIDDPVVPVVVSSAGTVAVPTLSPWSLAALGLALLLAWRAGWRRPGRRG